MKHRPRQQAALAVALAAVAALALAVPPPAAAGLFRITDTGTANNLRAAFDTLVWTQDYDLVKFVDTPARDYVTLHAGFGIDLASSAQSGTDLYYANMHTLFRSNGTLDSGTTVATLEPTAYEYTVEGLTDLGGTLFFRGYSYAAGFEPWTSDGSGPGTVPIADVFPGPDYGYYGAGDQAVFAGNVFFSGDDGATGEELWVSNGQAGGTHIVKNINPGPGASSDPSYFVACGTKVYFAADDGTYGRELWMSDGSLAGTNMAADVRSGAESTNPYDLTCVGSLVFFLSSNGTTLQHELWVYDPLDGAHLLKDDWGCAPTSFSCGPTIHTFTAAGGLLFFAAGDGEHGVELWKSDGTALGTTMVKDIWPGLDTSTGSPFPYSSDPYHFEEKGGKVYFGASHPDFGNEVWVSDGTPENTWPVTDAIPGPGDAWPDEITSAGRLVFFRTVGNNPYLVYAFDPADTPPYRDFVKDGSFEGVSPAQSWTLQKLSPTLDRRVCNQHSLERCSFKVVGSATAAKSLRQVLVDSSADLGAKGQVFMLSGWSKALNASAHGGFYGLEIVVTHVDGSTQTKRVPFTRATHPWQYRRLSLAATEDWSRVAVYVRYLNQAGTAWFDDVRLTIR